MNQVPEWLVGVGADLRTAVGDEFRAEAEAEEKAVADFRLRHRSLSEAAAELMHRGSRTTVSLSASDVTGEIIHAANDLATLAPATGQLLHVSLDSPVALRYSSTATRGRGRGRDSFGCDSFLAQLRSLELKETRVTLEGSGPAAGLIGRITTVAIDHIVFVTGDTEWLIPLHTVWGVWE